MATRTKSTPVGFEPTQGDPIGLAGRRLSRSAKVPGGMAKLQAVISTGHRATCLCHATLGGGHGYCPVARWGLMPCSQGRRAGRAPQLCKAATPAQDDVSKTSLGTSSKQVFGTFKNSKGLEAVLELGRGGDGEAARPSALSLARAPPSTRYRHRSD